MLSKWDSYCRVDLGSPSQNFFRAPPARSAGKPMEHSYRYWLRFGTRSGCQNFRASFQGFSKTSKRQTEAYRMYVGTDFLKLPPVTGQYWSLFQCSMLGTGGTCECSFNLGAGWGLTGARKLNHALQIITKRFNDPHSATAINNAQHIVHKTGTHWGEGHI